MTREERTFEDLLAAARAGDPAAVAALVHRFASRLEARVRRRLTPRLRRDADTADVVQSVLVELLRRLDRFEDRGERAFRNWLYTAAENRIRTRLRRSRAPGGSPRVLALEPEGEDRFAARGRGPATDAAERDDRRRAGEALASLSADQREVVRLRLEERRSFPEIAAALGLASADAARMRYARAVRSIRSRLPEDA